MPTEVLTADDGMTQDEKDLKAMAVLREIRADPHKDVEISSWGTTWTVTVEHHFVAQGPDLASAVLEAHAKAQPRAQKRCSGCRHSGHNKGNPNLLCKHTDNVRPVYVNHALGFGEPCGPNLSNFEQREDTYLNGDPKETRAMTDSKPGPKYVTAQRVAKQGEPHSGRIQNMAYDANARQFRYDVKWDNGPTTSHLENDLVHENLPETYP